MSPARIVAVDHGKRRVGLALADPLRMFAQPYGTFPPADAVAALEVWYHNEGLETIVVGWPLTPEGKEGAATDGVQAFINRLRRAFPGVEIVKWDERYTSEAAKEVLRRAGLRHKTRRGQSRVDATAAALILQEYLQEYLER